MKRILLVTIVLISQLVRAQEKPNIINALDSIPANVFSLNVDGLYIPPVIGDGKHYSGYSIYWPAPEIDGRYVLKITKDQLYVHSSHDNPNPNFLYWLMPITPRQYELITAKIKQQKKVLPPTGAKWSAYISLSFEKYMHTEDIYPNLEALIKLFNDGVVEVEQIKLLSRTEFDKISPIRIIDVMDE